MNFHQALMIIGFIMFLAWPLAIFMLRDRPSDMNQFPDGDSVAPG